MVKKEYNKQNRESTGIAGKDDRMGKEVLVTVVGTQTTEHHRHRNPTSGFSRG
jgi:hypothetical protein